MIDALLVSMVDAGTSRTTFVLFLRSWNAWQLVASCGQARLIRDANLPPRTVLVWYATRHARVIRDYVILPLTNPRVPSHPDVQFLICLLQ